MATVPSSSRALASHLDQQRQAVGDAIDKLRSRWRRDWDLRRQLAAHAGLAIALAAFTGFLVGRWLRRMIG